MNKNTIITVIIATTLSLVLSIVFLGGGKEIIVEKGGVGAVSSPDVYSYMNVFGEFQTHAGHLLSYVNSTSTTATTQTLIAADILNYNSVIMVPNIGATTFTLPASSTLSAMVPTAGDWFEQCWYNATSTAAATITLAAGTGIDLEVATSTFTGAVDLTISANGMECLKYFRQPATATTFDITVQMTNSADAD